MAPELVTAPCISSLPRESCARTSEAWRLAPSLPLRSRLTRDLMPPEVTTSLEFLMRSSSLTPGTADVRAASTPAACSCATWCSLPWRSTWMIGLLPQDSAIEILLAASIDCQSDQRAYSCASSEPSLSSATKRAIPPAIAIDMRLSEPASAFISRSAIAARLRTAEMVDPRRPTSS